MGARFDDRVTGNVETFAPEARIIHIDIDPAEIGKNVRVDIPVVGDVKRVLGQLLEILKPGLAEAWRDKILAWKKEYPLTYCEKDCLKPQAIIREICRQTEGKARITTGWASTRCVRLTTIRLQSLLLSPPAAWEPWDTDCRRQSGPGGLSGRAAS